MDMSTLRSKLDRGRSKKKSSSFNEIFNDDDEDEEKIHVKEKEESEHEPEEEDDASEEDEVAKPSKQGPPRKKASPEKKQEDAVEYADDPSSEDSEPEPEQKDDEDYHEPSGESDNDGDDDDGSFDEDDDEDYGQTSKKRKTAPSHKKKGRPPSNKKAKKAPAKESRSSARARKPTRYASDDDTDENEDEDEEEYDEKPAARLQSSSRRRDSSSSEGRRASPRSRKKTITSYKVVGSSEEEEDNDSEHDDSYSHPPVRRARQASAKALANIHQLRYRQDREAEDDEDDDDVCIASLSAKKSSRARKRKKIDSDDEDFQVIDEDQEKEEDDELDDDADFSGEDAPNQNKTVGNVEDADFYEDEQSDNESVKTPERHTPRKTASVAASDNRPHQDNSDDEVEIEPTPTKAKLTQEERTKYRKNKGKSTPPRMPNCPSIHDEITADQLPRIHVCCIAPDGQSRQCFALETLHKIATMSAHPAYRKDHLDDKHHQTFLQPPAFRTPMSEDLCDQIAARFGRQALDLNGHFYRRDKTASATKISSSDEEEDEEDNGYLINFTSAHTDTDGFMESWKEYQLRNMGSQDIYPCPLCYTVAHHRLKSSKKEIHVPHDFSYDPMTVLGSPDNEDFDIAAAFCFKKISQVKQHLRDDHGCKTAKIDSEVFMRYKVRTQDGLLQRFLANDHTYGKTKQGDMRRYWYDGNSELFIYLLYEMKQLQHYRDTLGRSNNEDPSDEDEGDLLADAKNYFSSFQDQAQTLWDSVIAPFDRSKTQDMSDFLVDGAEDEEGEVSHHMFIHEHAETSRSDDEAKVARYKRLAEEHTSSDESNDDVQYPQESFEESESEDEWVTNIRSKKRRLSKADGTSTPKTGKRRLSKINGETYTGESDSDAAIEKIGSTKTTPASSSKRAILEDSDSD